MEFARFFDRATGGQEPYRQVRLAEGGLPELLEVPTGAGKTLAVLLSWLWRLTHHVDVDVRRATRRLAYVLPLRVLMDQTLEVRARRSNYLQLAGSATGSSKSPVQWQSDMGWWRHAL